MVQKKGSLSSLNNKDDIFKSYDQIEMQKVARPKSSNFQNGKVRQSMQFKNRVNNLQVQDINTSTGHGQHSSQINIDNYFDSYQMPKTTKPTRMNNLFSPKRQKDEDEVSVTRRSDHFGGFSQKKAITRFKDMPAEDRQLSRQEVLTKFKQNVNSLTAFNPNSSDIS